MLRGMATGKRRCVLIVLIVNCQYFRYTYSGQLILCSLVRYIQSIFSTCIIMFTRSSELELVHYYCVFWTVKNRITDRCQGHRLPALRRLSTVLQ
jgi:hypothetical protein